MTTYPPFAPIKIVDTTFDSHGERIVVNLQKALSSISLALFLAAGSLPAIGATYVANTIKGTGTGSIAAAVAAANREGSTGVIQLVGKAATLSAMTIAVQGITRGATIQAPSLSDQFASSNGGAEPAIADMETAAKARSLNLLLDRQSATIYLVSDVPQRTAAPVERIAAQAPLAPAMTYGVAEGPSQRAPLPTLRPGSLPLIESRPPAGRRVSTLSAAPVDQGSTPYTIPAGIMLSEGLTKYVKSFGWSMRWNVKDDFRLDAPLPIPAGSMKEGVNYVVHTYQAQGALLGDAPDYHNPNQFVVIEPVTAAKETAK
ncbi:MAG: hypothetical protein ACREPQ_14650 [Rhodanobacter sp.]